jgi:DNA-3-methyladenine glycosylase II
VTPAAVLALSDEDLRSLGFSRQKTRYVRAIAEAGLDYEALRNLPDAEALAALIALTGVGRWTAECYLLMSEGRLDAFPGGDIALQEAIRWADALDARPDERAAYARAEAWRPYRGVAANLLWDWYVGVKAGTFVS